MLEYVNRRKRNDSFLCEDEIHPRPEDSPVIYITRNRGSLGHRCPKPSYPITDGTRYSFGLFSLHRDNGEYGSAKGRYGLEAHQAHFRCYAVWGGSDKEEPLCREVWDYDHVAGMRDQFHEHVPCNDEVGEHEEDGS